MNASQLTDDEINDLVKSDVHRRTPFMIRNVTATQLSIARHYGGAVVQGAMYDYYPDTDELIRHDVVLWLARHRKKQMKAERKTKPQHSQQDLF